MCGRYVRKGDKQRIAERFHAEPEGEIAMPDADYNVAPTTYQPIVRQSKDGNKRELALARWGLIPFDTRDFAKAERDKLILARADKLGALHSWREPARKRRCLVPASAFYEWPEAGRSPKQPYVFEMGSGEMFAFAGIWDAWKDERGHWLQSFAIVTTGANELMARIHSRMPVILHPRDYDRWLDRGEVAKPPMGLLRPYEADAMEMREANPAVNNVRNNGPEMLTKPETSPPTDMSLEF